MKPALCTDLLQQSVDSDQTAMTMALQLAKLGEGRVSPNPMVGCVVVQNAVVVGAGYHKRVGGHHAERMALLDMQERGVSAKGSTVYVNLEPCCHTGRTPPCTEILLEMQVAKVVVGMLDPDSRVAGEGVALLRRMGVEVVFGVQQEACQLLNHAYLLARKYKRPRFTLKTALTLDGYTADIFGQSKWITNPSSRLAGHFLRDSHDGILVGVGTVLADDPSLTTRLRDEHGNDTVGEHARPIILDSQMRTPQTAQVRTVGKPPIWFCNRDYIHKPERGHCLGVDTQGEGVDLDQVARHLVKEGIYSVLLEGGATIHRAFLEKGWVDRLEVFFAPKLIGAGKKALSMSPVSLSEVVGFDLLEANQHESDVHLRYITADWRSHV